MQLMPHTVSTTYFQRNFKKVWVMAKRLKEPIVILYRNKPDFVLIDYKTFVKKFYKK